MMETICKGEPVPVVLLKLGLKYHQDGMHADAIRAVSEACKYGYAQLKAIEHSGAVQAGPAVVVEMIVSDEPASKPAAP